MRKYIFTIALFLLGLAIAMPQSILAAAADVTFSELGYVSLTGVGSGVTLSVVAGSKVESMVVGTNTIVLVLGTGDHIEFSCATRNRMTTTSGTYTDVCGGSASTISITGSTTLTVSTDLCSSGTVSGGGGGGGGDSTAPSISDISVASGETDAVITWTTNENSISWVEYGTDTNYGSEEKTTSYITSHSVTLSDLSPGIEYHYQVKSKDSSGNIGTYTDKTFTTAQVASGEATVTASEGGIVTATADGAEASVEVPVGALSDDTVIIVDPIEVTGSGVVVAVSAVPTDSGIVGDYVYDYSATVDDVTVETFDDVVTITITYTDDQISGFDESTLAINYWDATAGEWVSLSTIIDTANNTLTATTDHFTYFAVIGETVEEIDEPDEPEDIIPISEMTATQLRAMIQDIMAQLQVLMTELVRLKGGGTYTGVPSTFSFTRNLKLGMYNSDIKYLQIMLNASADTRVAALGVGSSGHETNYFGNLTKAAVVKLQNKYVSSVLTPVGLSRGTGFVGSSTRGKLNSLLGK